MGETDRVLITFDKDNVETAREVIDNIVQALESVTLAVDHPLIANDAKMQSRETAARQRTSNHQYMETILTEWFNFEDEFSVSTLSSSEASQSTGTVVSLDSTCTNPVSRLTPHNLKSRANSMDAHSSASKTTQINPWKQDEQKAE